MFRRPPGSDVTSALAACMLSQPTGIHAYLYMLYACQAPSLSQLMPLQPSQLLGWAPPEPHRCPPCSRWPTSSCRTASFTAPSRLLLRLRLLLLALWLQQTHVMGLLHGASKSWRGGSATGGPPWGLPSSHSNDTRAATGGTPAEPLDGRDIWRRLNLGSVSRSGPHPLSRQVACALHPRLLSHHLYRRVGGGRFGCLR